MLFNATFNNISVILWLSVLLVEETGIPGENHQNSTKWIVSFLSLKYIKVSISHYLNQ